MKRERVKIVTEYAFEYEDAAGRKRLLEAVFSPMGLVGVVGTSYSMKRLKSRELKKPKKTR